MLDFVAEGDSVSRCILTAKQVSIFLQGCCTWEFSLTDSLQAMQSQNEEHESSYQQAI